MRPLEFSIDWLVKVPARFIRNIFDRFNRSQFMWLSMTASEGDHNYSASLDNMSSNTV